MSSSNQDRNVLRESNEIHAQRLAKQKSQIIQILKDRLDSGVFQMWFDDGRSIVVNSENVQILAENSFLLNRLQNRYWVDIRHAVEIVCGTGVSVDCVLDDAADSAEPEINREAPATLAFPAPSVESTRPNLPPDSESSSDIQKKRPKQGTESFWFGESNRLAHAGVTQMFEQLGQISPLVLYGPAGSGKTHLLESLVVDARRKHKLQRCIFLSAEEFTTNFVSALRGSGLPMFRRKYRDLDVLAVDDVQFFAGKKATLAEFQYTLDNLARNGKQVILSSDRPPIDLDPLGTDITARMMSGLVCPLNYPDAEGRFNILKQICQHREFKVPDNVLDLISRKLARDVRRLSGAINRIRAYSVASGKVSDLELARQALTDLFSLNGTLTTISSIEKVVCDFCGVKPAELKSSSRQKKLCAARMLAMYLSRQHTPNAYSEIGDYFGRTHSTVIAANKKFSSMVNKNQAVDLPNAKYLAKDALVQLESSLRLG